MQLIHSMYQFKLAASLQVININHSLINLNQNVLDRNSKLLDKGNIAPLRIIFE